MLEEANIKRVITTKSGWEREKLQPAAQQRQRPRAEGQSLQEGSVFNFYVLMEV